MNLSVKSRDWDSNGQSLLFSPAFVVTSRSISTPNGPDLGSKSVQLLAFHFKKVIRKRCKKYVFWLKSCKYKFTVCWRYY